MVLTEAQKLKYYKNKEKIHKVVKQNIEKRKHIVYGARALNAHFPPHLDRHTEDWDVYSNTPKKTAMRVEKKLDRTYGGDYFYVEQAVHPGTYKVKSRVTRTGVADYTKPDQTIPYKTIGGKRYVKLSHVKKHIKKTLKDPNAKFRHDKDREALQRIKLYENSKKKKRKVSRKPRGVNDLARAWGWM